MNKCAVCLSEKQSEEFQSMEKYGCTCKIAEICKSCAWDWLQINAYDGRADMANWICPKCRQGPRIPKTHIAVGDHPTESENETMKHLHEEWCAEYTNPPFPTVWNHEVLVTNAMGLWGADLLTRFYVYQGIFFCAIVCKQRKNWNMKCMLVVPIGSNPSAFELSDLAREQCYKHIEQCSSLIFQNSLMREQHIMYSEFNMLNDGLSFMEQVDVIHRLPSHANDRVGSIGMYYLEFLNGLASPEMSFVDFYSVN